MSKNRVAIPEARAAFEQFKYKVANETVIPLANGNSGELTSFQCGYMVKEMIQSQEKQMADSNKQI